MSKATKLWIPKQSEAYFLVMDTNPNGQAPNGPFEVQYYISRPASSDVEENKYYTRQAVMGFIFQTKEEAQEKAASLNKAYAEQITPQRWEPEAGEVFYYVGGDNRVGNLFGPVSYMMKEAGNYFQTAAKATIAAEYKRMALKSVKESFERIALND